MPIDRFVNTDLQRAAEALRLGRLDEASLHAWNALMTIGPEDVGELRRVAVAIGDSSLQRELEKHWPAGAAPPPATVRAGRLRPRLRIALAVIFILGVAIRAWNYPTEPGLLPATDSAFTASPAAPPPRPLGDGIWLVPLGKVETVNLNQLASELSHTYRAWSQTIEVVPLPRLTLYPGEEQLSAEALIKLLNERYLTSGRTTVIGITDYDIRSWYAPYNFSLRAQERNGVISTARLGADVGDRLQGHSRYERLRKLAKRQVEFHRNGALQNSDPHSLRRLPLSSVGEIDQLDEDL